MSQVGGQSYFEIDVDIHTWGNAALSAFNSIKEGIPKMIMRGGVRMDMCLLMPLTSAPITGVHVHRLTVLFALTRLSSKRRETRRCQSGCLPTCCSLTSI